MRYPSLDMARGFAIAVMLFINILTFLAADLPLFLKHNQPMVLPADLIAPLFQFIMGASLVISVNRRKLRGEPVWQHVLRRAVLLTLLGFVLIGSLFGFEKTEWGFLQSLGVGLLLAFLSLTLPVPLRMIAALAVLGGYAAASRLFPEFAYYANISNYGGPLSAIGYGTIAVFGTVAGEWLYRGKEKIKQYVGTGFVLVVLSLLLSLIVPLNRLESSATYMLFSTGFSFLITAVFYILGEKKKIDIKLLSLLGRNSLLLWTAQYIIVYLPILYILGGCCFMVWWTAIAATFLFLPLFYVIADVADWKGIRLPI